MQRFLIFLAVAVFSIPVQAQRRDRGDEFDALLGRMSLEEKIGQMMQLDLSVVAVPNSSPIRLDETRLREALITHHVGSLINTGVDHALTLEEWHSIHKTIQDMIRSGTRHKVPLLYGIASTHGASYVREATLFPQHTALAAARNRGLVRRCAEISARETRAAGIRWTFAPVVDVGRQPLWSRFPETFGEDPYLAAELGVQEIQGLQGDNLQSPTSVAGCMKHFLAYSFPQTGKDRSPTLAHNSYIREYLLPPFEAASRAGVRSVMVNSSQVNGVPVHASRYWLNSLLRRKYDFEGVVVSDWEDVIRLHTWHRVAESPEDAVRMAVDAGIDVSMVPLDYSFARILKQLVRQDRISESRIDDSVRRILRLKSDVGLFNDPYVEPAAAANFGRPEYRETALDAAEEAITLLKNEGGTLPLFKSSRVLVAGPAAKSLSALHGCCSYTWQGRDERWYPKDTPTIVGAISAKIGTNQVQYHQGVDFEGNAVDIDAAVAAAANVNAIVLCLGEDSYAEMQGDINDLELPRGQQELARRLYATGKPVVLVLVEGRGRIIREIEPQAKGILMAYWPGSQGATAIANILFGDTNPSGKLPFTYQRHANNLLTYDRNHTSRLHERSSASARRASDFGPQWEFGHGLSYTTFEYRNLRLSSPIVRGDQRLRIRVDVTNTGPRAGREAVELYTRDLYAAVAPPDRRLRRFEKITLQPGETRAVRFELDEDDLAFFNAASRLITEPGDFEVLVGDLSAGFRYEK